MMILFLSVRKEYQFHWTDSGCGNRSRQCMQQCPVQAADGPARATWSRPDIDPERTVSGYATWKLELFGGNWRDKNNCLHGNHP